MFVAIAEVSSCQNCYHGISPTERGLISERAGGVLENETSNGSWQRS